MALLTFVDGKVFQLISIKPKIHNLHCKWGNESNAQSSNYLNEQIYNTWAISSMGSTRGDKAECESTRHRIGNVTNGWTPLQSNWQWTAAREEVVTLFPLQLAATWRSFSCIWIWNRKFDFKTQNKIYNYSQITWTMVLRKSLKVPREEAKEICGSQDGRIVLQKEIAN
jgi:hypothetical protein